MCFSEATEHYSGMASESQRLIIHLLRVIRPTLTQLSRGQPERMRIRRHRSLDTWLSHSGNRTWKISFSVYHPCPESPPQTQLPCSARAGLEPLRVSEPATRRRAARFCPADPLESCGLIGSPCFKPAAKLLLFPAHRAAFSAFSAPASQLQFVILDGVSVAPKSWSPAIPPAHGAAEGGETAGELFPVPASLIPQKPRSDGAEEPGSGRGLPGLPRAASTPSEQGAGLSLANSHLHLQVRPHPTSRMILQSEQLPSPGQQQQVHRPPRHPPPHLRGQPLGYRSPPPLPLWPPELWWGKSLGRKEVNDLNKRNFFVLCKSHHMICY
ncbi:uncharacterized protein [Vicugna pacos]|uniref:Uncharacterized protein n=1 Tax=Vicugna pacos TaxID=30538 RepID=A0ABM5DZT9_VICPA